MDAVLENGCYFLNFKPFYMLTTTASYSLPAINYNINKKKLKRISNNTTVQNFSYIFGYIIMASWCLQQTIFLFQILCRPSFFA